MNITWISQLGRAIVAPSIANRYWNAIIGIILVPIIQLVLAPFQMGLDSRGISLPASILLMIFVTIIMLLVDSFHGGAHYFYNHHMKGPVSITSLPEAQKSTLITIYTYRLIFWAVICHSASWHHLLCSARTILKVLRMFHVLQELSVFTPPLFEYLMDLLADLNQFSLHYSVISDRSYLLLAAARLNKDCAGYVNEPKTSKTIPKTTSKAHPDPT